MMRRLPLGPVLAGLAAAAVLAGCGASGAPPSAAGTATAATSAPGAPASAPASAAPSVSTHPGALPSLGTLPGPPPGKPGGPAAPAVLTAAGIGPYQVGTAQVTLADQGRLSQVKTSAGCAGWATATGTGLLGSVGLVFYHGRLTWVDVSVAGIATAAGAHLGSTRSQLGTMYPGSVTLTNGTAKAVAVRNAATGNELLFRMDAAGRVAMIEAGPSEALEFRFTDGEGC